ncbi:MAG: cation transporter [Gammaproteobacteria bacterium]|jgi:copper chaperone|nr:cation transporter [Gammaproteobacteria bacterium]MBU1489840.1 cation transporter [Gammaproteobacteria bacterium]MBU2137483.1 cation transporter [Gammaproteobacteria bacterium]MBU2217425.1 cation transporter [Gammaproteobacteria bacterium]MBU2321530.1 cation transporter [Gammaproteobacteria bacterium]
MPVFTVTGLSCGHCVRSVTQAVQGLDATAQVQVELASGEVRIDSTQPAEALAAAIKAAGYSVVAVR